MASSPDRTGQPAPRNPDGTPAAGHRTLPHTADVRIEAWAPTLQECLTEAARAMVESFTDLSHAKPTAVREFPLENNDPENLLLSLLEELIYRMDAHAELPLSITLHGSQARCTMTDTTRLPTLGAVPKAVSRADLHVTKTPNGWHCTATVDV